MPSLHLPHWSDPESTTKKWVNEDRLDAGNFLVDFDCKKSTGGEEIELMPQSIGPLEVGKRIKVPLWAGLKLEKADAGLMKPPRWLNEQQMVKWLRMEKANWESFVRLPEHWFLVAQEFTTVARYFTIHPSKNLRQAYLALVAARRKKCSEGILSLDHDCEQLLCTNLTMAEITWFRQRACESMAMFRGMAGPGRTSAEGSSQNSSRNSRGNTTTSNSGLNTSSAFQPAAPARSSAAGRSSVAAGGAAAGAGRGLSELMRSSFGLPGGNG